MVCNSRLRFLSVFLACIVLFSCTENKDTSVDCDIQKGPCIKKIGGLNVIFDITPRPVGEKQEHFFRVRLQGNRLTHNRILLMDLSMPGMDMGNNQVILERNKRDVFEGRGVIVKCPSGKGVWKATVWIPDIGQVWFVFNLPS